MFNPGKLMDGFFFTGNFWIPENFSLNIKLVEIVLTKVLTDDLPGKTGLPALLFGYLKHVDA